MTERWILRQNGRERYRIAIMDESPVRVDVMLGAFIYNDDGARILDTWKDECFATRAEALAWIDKTTGARLPESSSEWERVSSFDAAESAHTIHL